MAEGEHPKIGEHRERDKERREKIERSREEFESGEHETEWLEENPGEQSEDYRKWKSGAGSNPEPDGTTPYEKWLARHSSSVTETAIRRDQETARKLREAVAHLHDRGDQDPIFGYTRANEVWKALCKDIISDVRGSLGLERDGGFEGFEGLERIQAAARRKAHDLVSFVATVSTPIRTLLHEHERSTVKRDFPKSETSNPVKEQLQKRLEGEYLTRLEIAIEKLDSDDPLKESLESTLEEERKRASIEVSDGDTPDVFTVSIPFLQCESYDGQSDYDKAQLVESSDSYGPQYIDILYASKYKSLHISIEHFADVVSENAIPEDPGKLIDLARNVHDHLTELIRFHEFVLRQFEHKDVTPSDYLKTGASLYLAALGEEIGRQLASRIAVPEIPLIYLRLCEDPRRDTEPNSWPPEFTNTPDQLADTIQSRLRKVVLALPDGHRGIGVLKDALTSRTLPELKGAYQDWREGFRPDASGDLTPMRDAASQLAFTLSAYRDAVEQAGLSNQDRIDCLAPMEALVAHLQQEMKDFLTLQR